MRVYQRRGCLIGESQERVARAIRLRRMPGDEGVSPTTKIPLLLARSKTTQGEGMRSSSSWIWGIDRLEITP